MKIGKELKVLVGFIALIWMAIGQVFAQMQPDIPQPRGPVDLNETANLIIFIILPALVVIGYLFWRRAMKRRRDEGQ